LWLLHCCTFCLLQVSMQASVAAEVGSGAESAAGEEEAGSGSDSGMETDWEEMGPSLQDFDEWPDAPVMMCPDPADRQQVNAQGLEVALMGLTAALLEVIVCVDE
jgi:hypothetical protein